MAILTDTSIMKYGMYKGKELKVIPTKYFLWLYKNSKVDHDMSVYIIDNLEVFKKEIKERG